MPYTAAATGGRAPQPAEKSGAARSAVPTPVVLRARAVAQRWIVTRRSSRVTPAGSGAGARQTAAGTVVEVVVVVLVVGGGAVVVVLVVVGGAVVVVVVEVVVEEEVVVDGGAVVEVVVEVVVVDGGAVVEVVVEVDVVGGIVVVVVDGDVVVGWVDVPPESSPSAQATAASASVKSSGTIRRMRRLLGEWGLSPFGGRP
jgi:hypothetical protein